MKVIFLDVDGVLNSDEYFQRPDYKEKTGIETDVDAEKVALLKEATDATGAHIVLTASMRRLNIGKGLIKLLNSFGIFPDSTPHINYERGLEIDAWLKEHPEVEDYVILDDEIYKSFSEKHMEKLIKISNGNGRNFGEGLLTKDVDEIIKRLGRKKTKEIEDIER